MSSEVNNNGQSSWSRWLCPCPRVACNVGLYVAGAAVVEAVAAGCLALAGNKSAAAGCVMAAGGTAILAIVCEVVGCCMQEEADWSNRGSVVPQ